MFKTIIAALLSLTAAAHASVVLTDPILLTGSGSWFWDADINGGGNVFASGSNGVHTAGLFFEGQCAYEMNPVAHGTFYCSGNAGIDEIRSTFFSASIGEDAFLSIYSDKSSTNLLARAPIIFLPVRVGTINPWPIASSGSWLITVPNPEPATWVLMIAGIAALMARSVLQKPYASLNSSRVRSGSVYFGCHPDS